MSGKLPKSLVEAWARCRVEKPKEGEKPREFGPPRRADADEKPFVMPADPFAQLRGGPDSEPPESEPEDDIEPPTESNVRATNGHAG